MKKLLIALIISLLVLTGCQSLAHTQISNADDVLFTVDGQQVTNGTVWTMLKNQSNIMNQSILNEAKQLLIESKVTVTDELKQEAQKMLDSNKALLQQQWAQLTGGLSDEELLEKQYLPIVKQKQFMNQYFDENAESLLKSEHPVKYIAFKFQTNENAQTVLTDLLNNVDIPTVIQTHGDLLTNQNGEAVLSKMTSLPTILQEFLNSDESKNLAWSQSPIFDKTTNTYYIIKAVELDSSKLKDEFKASFTTDQNTLETVFMNELKKAHFEIHDQDIYDGLLKDQNYKGYLGK